MRRRGVGPCLTQRFELRASLADPVEDVEQITVERASRSSRVTITTSPGPIMCSNLSNCGRRAAAPEIFSR
jgi:hypothetical protein